MNMNMIIGKRQIILAALVLGLGVAVYLNWQYSSIGSDSAIVATMEDTESSNYGEAQYVDSPQFLDDSNNANIAQETYDEFSEDAEAFFVEAKLTRQQARDEAVETLSFMLADTELTSDQKTTLAIRATNLADSIEIEGKIENLIKAKGFTDVMVYYDSERADVMIKTEGLLTEDVAKVRDIILKETNISVDNISIIEIG